MHETGHILCIDTCLPLYRRESPQTEDVPEGLLTSKLPGIEGRRLGFFFCCGRDIEIVGMESDF